MSDAAMGTEGAILCGGDRSAPWGCTFNGWEVQLFSAPSPQKDENQDSVAVLPVPEGLVVFVADGMGGHQDGTVASRLVIEGLVKSLRAALLAGTPIRNAVLDGIEAAHRSILALGSGAGSTVSAAILTNGRMRPVQVGDSMILLTGQRGKIKFNAVAHSPTGYAVEAGLLDPADALVHDDRHLVSNYVGFADLSIEMGAPCSLATRDTLVVASDGLSDNLSTEEILEIVRCGPLAGGAARLLERARSRMQVEAPGQPSKPDDLTFVLCRRAPGQNASGLDAPAGGAEGIRSAE